MNLRKIAAVCAVLAATAVSFGQSATLTSSYSNVSGGTVVTLKASANYAGSPGAVGWSVTLPEGWSFVASSGANPPQVGPQTGATGTLEWAYTSVPADVAIFTFTVKAGDKAGPVQLPSKLLLRVDGKQQTVEVAPAKLSVSS